MRCYFDHNATTPVSPAVLEAFLPAAREVYGNASSIHYEGQIARQRLEMARRQIAGAIGCQPREVVFTSGGTESNNLAIFGVVRNCGRAHPHVITTRIEHPSVLNACRHLAREGAAVTEVGVGADGAVDPSAIGSALRPETVLIAVMHANNETGAIQPIARIGAIAANAGVAFHIDGVQAFGRIPVEFASLDASSYAISGHKVGAPKGIGALIVRKGAIAGPLQFGGRQERGLRAGTENVPGAVALGHAVSAIRETAEEQAERMRTLRDLLEQGILARVPSAHVNAASSERLPNTSSICFEGIEGEAMVISLDLKGFAVSSGSACSSGAVEPSHVLLAMGQSPEDARSSVRFSLGRSNALNEVDALIDAVAQSAAHLRKLSPTYSSRES